MADATALNNVASLFEGGEWIMGGYQEKPSKQR